MSLSFASSSAVFPFSSCALTLARCSINTLHAASEPLAADTCKGVCWFLSVAFTSVPANVSTEKSGAGPPSFHSNQHIEDYEDEAGNPWLADDEEEPGKRALHLVAEGGGPLALLFLLLVAGARVDAQNDNQQTPLHVSAAEGSEAACRVLIEHRANVNAQGQDGKTPLDMADKEEVKAVLR